jgi:5'-3' exonuclease
MLCNLIIDGNFLLSKLVFTLSKNNILYSLDAALENAISNYRKLYPFRKIYLVSDSKEKSWRKKITSQYKTNRKKDNDIDWSYVYETYGKFKESLKGISVLEFPHVEGDDWISYISEESNLMGISNLIISNDYDIKQIVRFYLDRMCMNIMSNEMYNTGKIFLPKNYQIFMSQISTENYDIFNLNDNSEFIALINKFRAQYTVVEVDYIESLVVKLISGDVSDNISSVWSQTNKNGRKRGIGEKGALNIYSKYITEFGDVDLKDPDLFENIADIICENKKLSKTNIEPIIENLKNNSKLINLDTTNIPKNIFLKMKEIYAEGNK